MTARRNLGQTTLPLRRRADPMRSYDALPAPLRQWLANAVLAWSPASCLRIWRKARANGATPHEALALLDRVERATLSRDRITTGEAGSFPDYRTANP